MYSNLVLEWLISLACHRHGTAVRRFHVNLYQLSYLNFKARDKGYIRARAEVRTSLTSLLRYEQEFTSFVCEVYV